MEFKAELNYLRIAPRKVRLVANLVKGMNVHRASLELRHLSKRSAVPVLKLLRSAVADAKQNFDMKDEGDLYVKSVIVNEGPVLKRMTPRAFGRGALIRKKMSHISLVLGVGGKAGVSKRIVKKIGPVVREVTAEDKETETSIKPRGLRERAGAALRKTKPVDFVRRVFRRKVI